jgi:hypothetical protein
VTPRKDQPARPKRETREEQVTRDEFAAARQRARERAGDEELPRKSGAPKQAR